MPTSPRCNGNSSHSTSSEEDEGSDEDSDQEGPPDTITHHIKRLRIEHANWTKCHIGPESAWDSAFNTFFAQACKDGERDRFLSGVLEHSTEGRYLLRDLKALGDAGLDSTPDEIRDLFMQGFELAVSTMAEVKFFELKLDQYAPTIPSTAVSHIRVYDVKQASDVYY